MEKCAWKGKEHYVKFSLSIISPLKLKILMRVLINSQTWLIQQSLNPSLTHHPNSINQIHQKPKEPEISLFGQSTAAV
jgi:hypothetical protein